MDFQLDEDFQFFELGIDVGADRFMLILETDFLASTSGSYEFRSVIDDDKSMIWIDLDHNGKYERIGKSGSERLKIKDPLPGTFDDTVNLTAGKSYRMAFILAGIGGTHKWELLYTPPGGSRTRIKPLQSSQNGMFTTTRLSNQSTGDLQTRLEANATGLVAGNTYYYRIKGANSASDWADATGTFVAESAISQTTGSLTFDTDGPTPRWSSSDGRSGTGQIITTTYLDSQSNSISYKTAKFDFNNLTIGDGVQVHLLGSNPLHLQVSGDATISATLDLNGTSARTRTSDFKEIFETLGRLGGGSGGKIIVDNYLGAPGNGPAHLANPNQFYSGGKPYPGGDDYRASGLVGGNAAGGGSYGGIGGRPEPTGGVGYNNTSIPASGKTYGTPELTHLLAGSGGGAGRKAGGGSGAGAIKIVATGTLNIGGDIWAVGGKGGDISGNLTKSGASGSGGAIFLKAPNMVIQSGVTISANGGASANIGGGFGENSSDGGEAGAAAGGGGRIYVEASQSLVNHASVTHSNLTASGGQSAGERHGTDGTVKIIRPQVSSLTFTTGTLTIDTDNAEINHSDGSFLAGTLEDKSVTLADSTVLAYKVCVFTADSINLGSGVIVNLVGRNALSLRTRNNGNLTIGTQFIANGGSVLDRLIPAIGKLGGFDGGARDADGMGPGGGLTKYNSERGGSAGYGGMGFSDGDATRGQPYGNAELTHLLGGSGGGGGNTRTGGAGGGAIELIAHGDGLLSLTTSAKISVNGGDADIDYYQSGGAGSGGAIRLEGGSISCLGTLEAKSSPTFANYAGGGGRIAVHTDGNLVLGSIDLSGYRPGTLHISGATATSSLDFSSGTLTFDTTHGYWHHTSGVHGTGVLEQKDDNGIQYKTCTFTFDSLNLASGLTVKLQGDNSLILKTRNHGNITVGTNPNANGGDAEVTPSGFSSSLSYGIGRLGGYDGGDKNSSAHGNGLGTGGGKYLGGGVTNNFVGGGGGYGTPGQYHSNDTAFGKTYGSTALTHLHGGSGGGGASNTGGGAGGGAISLEADGNGTLTIQSGATISANGGGIASTLANAGGGGSGGSIRLAGKSITNNGSIQAKGGTPPTTSSTYDGGIGGGGRVAFNYSTNLVEGTVDVGSGAYVGTKAYNTPPTISSALTASITYSNDNYRKRSTVRYDDLVFWYPFDETSGSIAEDFSTHERNATLINMSGANRIAGKSGGALSFTTTPLDLSTQQTNGQYLDLGDWSFGGDFTFSAWVRVDYNNIGGMTLMDIGNGVDTDNIMLRHTADGKVRTYLTNTSSGTEAVGTSNPFYSVGQWIHLLVTMNDGGANASTVKFYRDGSLFETSSADLSPPLVKTRTKQFIGRSTNDLKYFQGDLDDLRLYDVVLTDSEITTLYGEAASGIHYQAQALNNPTGFSAIGLPTGLSINPTTGAITGHTTAVGDHNITLTASNLSGTSPSKNLILTVAPDKPLFETEPFTFNPGNLADLKLWLDASDSSTVTHTSNAVTQWRDKSGNANHMSGSDAPTTSTRLLNGKNVIDFDGNDYFESSAAYASGNDFSILMVAGIDSIDNENDSIFAIRQEAGHPSFQIRAESSSSFQISFYQDGMGTDKQFSSSTQHGPSIYEFVFNDSTNLLEVFLDGTTLGTTAYTSTPNQGNKLTIFANRGKNQGLDGFVAEMITTTSALSTMERQKIEGYLAHKWGLTGKLPSAHPFKHSLTSQPRISVSAIGTNSANINAHLIDLGGASTSLKVMFAEANGTVLETPETISSLQLWLDAADSSTIAHTSNLVSQWNDKSGNGYHALPPLVRTHHRILHN